MQTPTKNDRASHASTFNTHQFGKAMFGSIPHSLSRDAIIVRTRIADPDGFNLVRSSRMATSTRAVKPFNSRWVISVIPQAIGINHE